MAASSGPRTYFVSGASRGIGLELCKGLAARGDVVIAASRTVSPALRELVDAKKVEWVELEVTDERSIAAAASRLDARAIDVLINNAGVSSTAKSIMELSMEELQRVFAVNASSPLLVTRALLPNLRRGSRRLVMNVSSQLASIANNKGGSTYPYRASKTALNQLTVCAAHELRGEGFCCVCVHPGWVKTDMGGPNAPLAPAESAAYLIKLADTLTPEKTGSFLNYDGAPMPW
jgi:NAD(P)-dependent dehydrogenase (short-subunit alcohol dehydrogenase family)